MQISGREPVYSTNGIVCSISPQAVSVGLDILSSGGNAFDAIVAMAAVEAVTTPVGCGLGGEPFGIFYHAESGKTWGMTGSGRAPSMADKDYFTNLGYDSLPLTGPIAAAIPGEIHALESINQRLGTLSFDRLLEPAIKYSEEGFPVSRFNAGAFAALLNKLNLYPDTATIFTNGGDAIREGQVLRQPHLADTLRKIARNGAGEFYEGEIAEKIVKDLCDGGSLYTLRDFSEHETVWYEDPISCDYRGRKVVETSPPSQGLMVLETLNILEEFDLSDMGFYTPETIHAMVEAKKLAFADRNAYMGDPDFVSVPTTELISKPFANLRRRSIDLSSAMTSPSAGTLGLPIGGDDTSYLCAVDSQGNAVSFIHSLSMGFGCGFVAGDTGVLLNNRIGRGFNLIEGHPNVIEPRKKTMHTLNAYMVFDNGIPYFLGGTPGGDKQIPWNVQTIINVIDFGMNPQQAVDSPRWTHTPGTDPETIDDEPLLDLDPGIRKEEASILKDKGHVVDVNTSGSFGGSAKMILIDRSTGVLSGGSDRRSDGLAGAL